MNERQLKRTANAIRQDTIKSLANAESGHSADSLGIIDVLTALYFHTLTHKPRLPNWKNRDRLHLGNGQISPAVYSTLAHAGYFAKKQLRTLRKKGSPLQGHPTKAVPGIESSPAGLSIATGCALAGKMDNANYRTYCILSDEEHNQGHTWESILFASKHNLRNLTVIIDRNNIQRGGYTEEVLPLEPLREKYEAFNWNVIEVDGHNMAHIIDALEEARTVQKPTAIIAHTIPGKGVSFIENDFTWHEKPPTKEQAEVAIAELEHERRKL